LHGIVRVGGLVIPLDYTAGGIRRDTRVGSQPKLKIISDAKSLGERTGDTEEQQNDRWSAERTVEFHGYVGFGLLPICQAPFPPTSASARTLLEHTSV
jgi:hypothetical protein